MKTKRLLSVIAVILALLITLNTASAAMGTAADYLNEITATENSNESEMIYFRLRKNHQYQKMKI